MHSHLLQVFLVACLVLPCLGTALKEEGTRKGKRTKVEQDTDSLKGEEGEAFGNNVLTSSDAKNEGLQMWNPLESERESGNEKRATRKGKRTRVEQDTDSLKGEEETTLGYNMLTLSKDKNEGSRNLSPLEAERKRHEKRATRKGKRANI
ncbi:uncharacterized protein LOC116291865 [Actinia tenebrosa]|uniref:Uncharacterized protein LOC116291865 n=1 Tax=Actinia tenebrosa TaxID=6105 RepID=A0A6P8HQL6_ACTTE|nr:uncharacterized protein LOC116291865 [Actinia tenebrosa]